MSRAHLAGSGKKPSLLAHAIDSRHARAARFASKLVRSARERPSIRMPRRGLDEIWTNK